MWWGAEWWIRAFVCKTRIALSCSWEGSFLGFSVSYWCFAFLITYCVPGVTVGADNKSEGQSLLSLRGT